MTEQSGMVGDVAHRAVASVASALGIAIEWARIEEAAKVLVKVLTRDPFSEAEIEGLRRASKVVDADSAEAAAVERNRVP